MNVRWIIFATFFVLLGAVSLSAKVATMTTPTTSDFDELATITAQLKTAGLEPIGDFPLTHDSSYLARAFRGAGLSPISHCRIFILPMRRNAEAVALLGQFAEVPRADVFYLLDDEVYDRFPNLEFWQSRIARWFGRLIGLNNGIPQVFGIAAAKTCRSLLRFGFGDGVNRRP